MAFTLTVLEIFVACILIVGFINEEKLARFEQRTSHSLKRRLRRSLKKRKIAGFSAVKLPASEKYCA